MKAERPGRESGGSRPGPTCGLLQRSVPYGLCITGKRNAAVTLARWRTREGELGRTGPKWGRSALAGARPTRHAARDRSSPVRLSAIVNYLTDRHTGVTALLNGRRDSGAAGPLSGK